MMKTNFKKVISYSQNIDHPKVDKLLNEWEKAKARYINAWGGPIYEVGTVTFELDTNEKNQRINEFIDNVENVYDLGDLANFIEVNRNNFFDNISNDEYNCVTGACIPKGIKLIKAFKYFTTGRALRDLQDAASMLIQENKVTGTLCFSVHPLDFLSSSENTYNWRSCHALDGDYRAGNLSYMVDKSTIVCYLRGEQYVKLPNFPNDVYWNNKKWRMLLFSANDGNSMFAGRQYPFSSRTGLEIIKSRFLQSMKKTDYNWSNWHNDFITNFRRQENISSYRDDTLRGRHISMFNTVYPMHRIIDNKSELHFNDLLSSTCYIPYYCWLNWYGVEQYGYDYAPKFEIGGQVKCLCCGKNQIEDSDSMMCPTCQDNEDCNNYCYCSCCDSRLEDDEGYYNESTGETMCYRCAHTYLRQCDCCAQYYFKSEITFDTDKEIYLCEGCIEALEELENGERQSSES